MKAKDVLNILGISRPTLTKYVKEKKVLVVEKDNGQYDYDKTSVYALLNGGVPRKTVLYSRVSTSKQKPDLQNQTELLKQFCFARGLTIGAIYEDIASGISFDKRKGFFAMLDEIIAGKVETVVITYKDRLSRIGFELFSHLFKKFNTEIIVISEVGSTKLDSEEIFEEIISLLHCYSMKLYSKRKNTVISDLIKNE